MASWGGAHEEDLRRRIEAGKDVFCEKPLTTTVEASQRVLEAEVAHVEAGGRRLVQVGFMRRYDAGYRQMLDTLASGELGAPLMMLTAHRNAEVPPNGLHDRGHGCRFGRARLRCRPLRAGRGDRGAAGVPAPQSSMRASTSTTRCSSRWR